MRRSGYAVLTMLAVLAGCATKPQLAVPLSSDAISVKSGRIGVATTPIPTVDTSFPGAGCLLCMAAASLANSSLTAQTQKLPPEGVAALKTRIADALRQRGADVVVIEETVKLDALPSNTAKGANLATKDFSSLKSRYKVDKLLLVDIRQLGIERRYSAYVPNSDPKAVLRGTGYLVDLSTNTYSWYLPVSVEKSADGKWDEPPSYPGLSNAYFQALELGKDAFMEPFIH